MYLIVVRCVIASTSLLSFHWLQRNEINNSWVRWFLFDEDDPYTRTRQISGQLSFGLGIKCHLQWVMQQRIVKHRSDIVSGPLYELISAKIGRHAPLSSYYKIM